jgi:hypothetical protein
MRHREPAAPGSENVVQTAAGDLIEETVPVPSAGDGT